MEGTGKNHTVFVCEPRRFNLNYRAQQKQTVSGRKGEFEGETIRVSAII